YKADIVMLDFDHTNWLPFNDPVNQLVHTEDGTAVASVMTAAVWWSTTGASLPSISPGCATASRKRASVWPPPMPTTAASTKPSNRSSAAIAQVWPASPTTSTATAHEWGDHQTSLISRAHNLSQDHRIGIPRNSEL